MVAVIADWNLRGSVGILLRGSNRPKFLLCNTIRVHRPFSYPVIRQLLLGCDAIPSQFPSNSS